MTHVVGRSAIVPAEELPELIDAGAVTIEVGREGDAKTIYAFATTETGKYRLHVSFGTLAAPVGLGKLMKGGNVGGPVEYIESDGDVPTDGRQFVNKATTKVGFSIRNTSEAQIAGVRALQELFLAWVRQNGRSFKRQLFENAVSVPLSENGGRVYLNSKVRLRLIDASTNMEAEVDQIGTCSTLKWVPCEVDELDPDDDGEGAVAKVRPFQGDVCGALFAGAYDGSVVAAVRVVPYGNGNISFQLETVRILFLPKAGDGSVGGFGGGGAAMYPPSALARPATAAPRTGAVAPVHRSSAAADGVSIGVKRSRAK